MNTPLTKQILRNCILIACAAIALIYLIFCVYYIINSHQRLLQEFVRMSGGCFYKLDNFQSKMFTPDTKRMGNLYCLLAIPCVLVFSYGLYHNLIHLSFWAKLRAYIFSQRHSIWWVLALLVFSLSIAYWGHSRQAMSTDEAFSALNFASMPVAHLMSYYPIPNNHIFFNFLNHFASLILGNAFLSGRLLAVIFYTSLIIGNFFLFRYFIKNNFLSFLCCALLSLQFIVYGFGHQARGYSLYYFLFWCSLVALYGYFKTNKNAKKEFLFVLLCCNILGFWTVPVFIYAIIVQLMMSAFYMISKKRLDRPFIRMMFLSGIGVFLVYLPILSYSGLSAIFPKSNGVPPSLIEVSRNFPGYFRGVAQICFGFPISHSIVALCIFFVPVIFFIYCKRSLKKLRPLLWIYLLSWFAVILMAFFVRQFSPFRVLGIQMHLSLALILLIIVVLITQTKRNRAKWISCFSVGFFLLAFLMLRYDKRWEDTNLYGQNPNEFMAELREMPLDFPKNASIWLSDESFMWPFLLKDFKNVQNYDCNFNYQDFLFLSEDDKPLPANIMLHYKEKSHASWFVVYRRVD